MKQSPAGDPNYRPNHFRPEFGLQERLYNIIINHQRHRTSAYRQTGGLSTLHSCVGSLSKEDVSYVHLDARQASCRKKNLLFRSFALHFFLVLVDTVITGLCFSLLLTCVVGVVNYCAATQETNQSRYGPTDLLQVCFHFSPDNSKPLP